MQKIRSMISRCPRKQPLMDRTINRSCHRAGINEKPEDKWWFDERTYRMTERQRVIWPPSMPECAEMNRTLAELTCVCYSTGEQNKDMKDTRTLPCLSRKKYFDK